MNNDCAVIEKKRIIWIICPQKEHLFRVQSLRALISFLANDDRCECVVFSVLDDKDAQQAISFFPDVRFVLLDAEVKSGFSRMFTALIRWAPIIQNTAKYIPPDQLILVDKWGLLLMPFVKIKKTKATYFNFELRINAETKRFTRRMVNTVEAILHRKVGATIIQDEWRLRALKKEHNIKIDHKVFFLPNSSIGMSCNFCNNELRNRLGISPDRIILVYIGSLLDHFMIRELVEAVAGCEELFLLLHSPRSGINDTEIRSFVRRRSDKLGNIYLSEEMLHPDELDVIMQGSDIGISFIKPIEGNYLNEILMGFSSGKMCAYVKNGLPLITSKFHSVEWVAESGSGICIPHLDNVSLKDGVRKIMLSYSSYSQNAAEFFDRCLSLDKYLPALKMHFLESEMDF